MLSLNFRVVATWEQLTNWTTPIFKLCCLTLTVHKILHCKAYCWRWVPTERQPSAAKISKRHTYRGTHTHIHTHNLKHTHTHRHARTLSVGRVLLRLLSHTLNFTQNEPLYVSVLCWTKRLTWLQQQQLFLAHPALTTASFLPCSPIASRSTANSVEGQRGGLPLKELAVDQEAKQESVFFWCHQKRASKLFSGPEWGCVGATLNERTESSQIVSWRRVDRPTIFFKPLRVHMRELGRIRSPNPAKSTHWGWTGL